jgi:hypothetical protein
MTRLDGATPQQFRFVTVVLHHFPAKTLKIIRGRAVFDLSEDRLN